MLGRFFLAVFSAIRRTIIPTISPLGFAAMGSGNRSLLCGQRFGTHLSTMEIASEGLCRNWGKSENLQLCGYFCR